MTGKTKKIITRVSIGLAILCVLLFAVFLYLFPWAFDNNAIDGVEGPPIPIISLDTELDELGVKAYERTCIYCHDMDIGPSLRNRDLPAAVVKVFARNGAGAMPAFRESELSNKELEAIGKLIEENRLPEVVR